VFEHVGTQSQSAWIRDSLVEPVNSMHATRGTRAEIQNWPRPGQHDGAPMRGCDRICHFALAGLSKTFFIFCKIYLDLSSFPYEKRPTLFHLSNIMSSLTDPSQAEDLLPPLGFFASAGSATFKKTKQGGGKKEKQHESPHSIKIEKSVIPHYIPARLLWSFGRSTSDYHGHAGLVSKRQHR
jgi:hypothetical protein